MHITIIDETQRIQIRDTLFLYYFPIFPFPGTFLTFLTYYYYHYYYIYTLQCSFLTPIIYIYIYSKRKKERKGGIPDLNSLCFVNDSIMHYLQ